MSYRISVFLSGMLLTLGMWAAVAVGAGVASATTDEGSDASSSSSSSSAESESESANSTGRQWDPGNQDPSSEDTDDGPTSKIGSDETAPSDDSEDTAASDDSDETAASDGAEQAGSDASTEEADESSAASRDDEKTVSSRSDDRKDTVSPDTSAAAAVRPEPSEVLPSDRNAAADPDPAAVDVGAAEPVAAATDDVERRAIVVIDAAPSDVVEQQPTAATFAFAAPNAADAAEAAAANPPTVLDLIGTVFFNIFTLGFSLFAGPPQLPPGSTVTVRSSTLELRPGYHVPADWYVPENPEPDRLVYFQHGFITNASPYSYTIAALAENTNSIVVAPSVTSNFFATDGFWLAGTPMQQALANLFTGDRVALTASLTAAFGPEVTLPERVVFVGHSYAAQTLTGAASRMVVNGTVDDLAGIVLLDGVTSFVTDVPALGDLPGDLPVYNIASPPTYFSGFGRFSTALVNARPGEFVGVQLVNGSHVDSMQGGNPLIQLAGNLAIGASRPENIEAVKILASGWINDMFDPSAGMQNGIYAAPGATIQIPNDAGTATALAHPAQNPPLGPLDQLTLVIGDFVVGRFFNFEPTEGGLVLF